MLMDKERNEAKAKCACQQKVYQHHLDMEILEAKRACQQKVYQHHLDMEILEAGFQWWQKLIFYYYADH